VKERQIEIRTLTLADIPAADEIRRSEGWNQTLTDWTRIIEHQSGGCFAALCENRLVGVVSTTVHNGEVAWIGMMLVHRDFRRQGIGKQLMTTALDFLDEQVPCIKLDATPAGRPVYLKLGFQEEGALNRWYRGGPPKPFPDLGLDSAAIQRIQQWQEIAEVDQRAFGVDRGTWCQALARYSLVIGHNEDGGRGVGMLRPGDRVPYMGPIVADSAAVGCRIAEELSAHVGGLFWDIPHQNQAARRTAEKLGFEPVRELYRMYRGASVRERPEMQFAITGPETG
jgi:RimJ/RimL family protein N-acetyltransferase